MQTLLIPRLVRGLPVLLLALAPCLTVTSEAEAQNRGPISDTHDVGLLLRQLDGEKRVLMIGAHPDDEDTALLAALARGYGAQTAYLSLSRGEGGQNLIGPELGEGLGIIRTGELLAARELDGARQYFSRAFDFGYSKNAEETFGHWPEEALVRDVVWVIRTFRPQIVASIFSGTPQDGHGQHQAAGIAARRAFELAGDPSVFPDQLALGASVWSPQRLYRLDRRGGPSSTVRIETGRFDPLLGASYFQIAMEGRSQHRSQDMGAPQTPGPQQSGAILVEDALDGSSIREGGSDGFFTGIDTTLATAARATGVNEEARLLELVSEYRGGIAQAVEELHPLDPARSIPSLQAALRSLSEATALVRASTPDRGREHFLTVLQEREDLATRALLASAGVTVDVRLDRDRLVAGDRASAEVIVWNGGAEEVTLGSVGIRLPEGWSELPGRGNGTVLSPNSIESWTFPVEVPTSATPSQPYFLRQERSGDLYEWPADASAMAMPGNPPLVTGAVSLSVGDGPALEFHREASYVGVDKATGEFRTPVHVVPALSVALEPGILAWPVDRSEPRSVSVRVRNLANGESSAEVTLLAPSGWETRPDRQMVRLAPDGGEASVEFRIVPSDAARGSVSFQAVATVNGRSFADEVVFFEYPHIEPEMRLQPAELVVSRFPVSVAPDLTVGYVMGSGDAGLQALEDLGVRVESLGPEVLFATNLDRFDAIVLGIRAYETRPDLIAANERLLEFARQGGTVVAQYNKYEYPAGGFAPFPVEMARPHDRVTDPDAEVTFLDPGHPILASPNALSSEDFEGWVQERGLYFLNEWDERYDPLLEMADPGETPNRGSLVVAPVGDGAYVYTGLALFRQLPAGVPGAYRLLANLVSLHGSEL